MNINARLEENLNGELKPVILHKKEKEKRKKNREKLTARHTFMKIRNGFIYYLIKAGKFIKCQKCHPNVTLESSIKGKDHLTESCFQFIQNL